MRKQLVALSLIIIVLIILTSTSLAKGYLPQFNAQDRVESIKDAVTFVTHEGYNVQLANIRTNNLSDFTILQKYLPYNKTIYFDILNQTISYNKPTFTAVVYLEYNDASYVNLNKILMQEPNYEFLFDGEAITPYTWNEFVPKETLTNNTNGLDLSSFEENRASLIDTYNSQTLAHAGYLVTVTLAIAALFVTIPSETKLTKIFGKNSRPIVFLTFLSLITIFIFILYRLIFWSWMSSAVLGVTPQESLTHGTPTLASGIQEHLANYYKSNNWDALPNLFYFLSQDYFFITSSLIVMPVIAFASLYFTNIVTMKTNANEQLKYVILVGVATILFLIMPVLFSTITFPFSWVTIISLDILSGIIIYFKFLKGSG